MSTTSGTDTHTGDESRRSDVDLRLPADNAYASVLRTTTAGLAARLDFPIDDIEDLRIAVGEATAMVLPESVSGGDLRCQFYLERSRLTLSVSVSVDHDVEPDYDSFAWQVLTTLAGTSTADCTDGVFTVTLTMESSLAEAGY